VRTKSHTIAFWAILAAVFFLPFLGAAHLFDWDEINFAEIAREMVVLQNYLEVHMNFAPFTEKPPLFFWLQAASMKIFGVGDYAARFPNAVLGILVLPLLFKMGKTLHGSRFGFYWAIAYFGSILPHLYFKSGIIDPVFNLFIFAGIYMIIQYTWVYKMGNTKRADEKAVYRYLIFAGILTGLAVLTKGPVAYLVTCLTLLVYWVSARFKWYISVKHFAVYTGVMLATIGIWAGLNWLKHGPTFMVEFTERQWALLTTPDAGHGGFLGYHFVVLLFGCFPASIFAIQALIKRDSRSNNRQNDFRRWMVFLFWVVLILFSLVSTKIVHYSSLAYYPLTFLAALSMLRIEQSAWRFTLPMKIGLWFIGGLAACITLALPFLGMNIQKLKPLFENDPFAVANLQADVGWQFWDAAPGVLMVLVLVMALVVYRNKSYTAFKWLFFGTGLWVMATLFFALNNIESISQRAAIEFWEKRAGENCYVITYGYKSYAHVYYARTKPHANGKQNDANWLLHGPIDKPVYISCKINEYEKFEAEVPDAKFLYAKNGFYFYKRTPTAE
jgi:4-amino-4-deoxy-L-arabinose transferase-like glycosyltransferase